MSDAIVSPASCGQIDDLSKAPATLQNAVVFILSQGLTKVGCKHSYEWKTNWNSFKITEWPVENKPKDAPINALSLPKDTCAVVWYNVMGNPEYKMGLPHFYVTTNHVACVMTDANYFGVSVLFSDKSFINGGPVEKQD